MALRRSAVTMHSYLVLAGIIPIGSLLKLPEGITGNMGPLFEWKRLQNPGAINSNLEWLLRRHCYFYPKHMV